ncbi:MAG: phosphopantetheine-binding protein, partial [Acidimicrobiales bacterium]
NYSDYTLKFRNRAFVVASPSFVINRRALRGWIAQRLPRPSVPDAIEEVPELPKLPNGKVDRSALASRPPPPRAKAAREPVDEGAEGTHHEHHEQENAHRELERRLTAIWHDVIGSDEIDLDDDFFEIGGDSLRALSLVTEISRHLKLDVPVWLVVEHPTVRAMARALGEGLPSRRVITVQRRGRGIPLFVAHDVYGSIFGPSLYIDAMDLDEPVYGFRADSWEGRVVEQRSLEDLAARYAEDVRAENGTGPAIVYGQGTAGNLAFEVARQLREGGTDLALLVLAGSNPFMPLDLAEQGRRRLSELGGRPLGESVRGLGALFARASRYVAQTPSRRSLRRRREQMWEQVTAVESVGIEERREYARQYYSLLSRRYRPPSAYAGPVLVIEPAGADPELVRYWRAWTDGPVEVMDIVSVKNELDSASIRSFEWFVTRSAETADATVAETAAGTSGT